MAKRYIRINWQNAPSAATPRTAENFNIMDKGIKDCDDAIGDLALLKTTAKADLVAAINEQNDNFGPLGTYTVIVIFPASAPGTTLFSSGCNHADKANHTVTINSGSVPGVDALTPSEIALITIGQAGGMFHFATIDAALKTKLQGRIVQLNITVT